MITRFGQKREPLYFPYTRERRQLRKITQFFTAATGAGGRATR